MSLGFILDNLVKGAAMAGIALLWFEFSKTCVKTAIRVQKDEDTIFKRGIKKTKEVESGEEVANFASQNGEE